MPNTEPRDNRPIVLVVDDAPASLGLLCEILEQGGYSVRVAQDGATALRRLQLLEPAAILLDAKMPGLSGFETCRRIKADAALAHIPVIFMTGLSDSAHVLQGFASGGVDYVTKPLCSEEVLARLNIHARNAKLAQLSREALEAAGLGVLLLDAQRALVGCSPAARHWLGEHGLPPDGRSLPPGWWAEPGALLRIPPPDPGAAGLQIRNLGPVGQGETLLLLQACGAEANLENKRHQTALTSREAEVLSWLSKGKTNRDIADILSISPRTVNKHLEHLFEKLGVETRSAAAAIGALQSRA
ncbi:DNA-binding NarL/FixJ family response regulator [Paucibacter oligotrophus]|uniref:DNA-binding NarL/FixJ family response regulator n=1 Tax=Roseateles oligotrophus TaxID=1769250 RepID=A0A840L386_9BURK|nr:response regulator transcription factor [Roseateles oligotrophus]MBB4842690.1 DNA-binding NarL/FixJ family response regulator [Roseateles oligotrophus]